MSDEINIENETESIQEGLEATNELAEKDKTIKELESKILRLNADLQNTTKRLTADCDNASKFAVSKFASNVLRVHEVLKMALDHTKESDIGENVGFKNLYEGLRMSLNELEKSIHDAGVKEIKPEIGSKFDHNYHQALERVPNDLEIGSIVSVIRCGYSIYNRILMPAMVRVSSGPIKKD